MFLKKLFGGKSSEQNEQNEHKTVSASQKEEPSQETMITSPANTDDVVLAPHLEKAILENVRDDNPETRNKVYQELLFSELFIALADEETPAKEKPAAEQQINIALMKNPAGIDFAAVFTSSAAAKRWRPNGGNYASLKGQDLFRLMEKSPAEVIVVNAASAPFVVLTRVEFRQLGMGVVPQTPKSPVQAATGGGAEAQEGSMQISFPSDVFNDKQKEHAKKIMLTYKELDAAVLAAVKPPNQEKEEWIRAVFIRPTSLDPNPESLQKLCGEVQQKILSNQQLFKDFGFEVGVMPDPSFWEQVNQNNLALFDRKLP